MRILFSLTQFIVAACFVFNIQSYENVLKEMQLVDFDISMQAEHGYISKKFHFDLARNLFNDHVVQSPKYSQTLRIPKIIHQIWLGSPFPERCKQLRATWLQFHPDWQYMLWTEKEIKEFGLRNAAMYDAATNWGEKSDIARYEILYRLGGLYVDTDFECLKPFDILHHMCDFYAGLGYDMIGGIYNGLIGTRAGHPILKIAIEDMRRPLNASNDSMAIMMRCGPGWFSHCWREGNKFDVVNVNIAFPFTFFYPWPNYVRQDRSRSSIEQWIKPETFAIHHWHSSWAY